jgi:sugar lactone lactonase YvrE
MGDHTASIVRQHLFFGECPRWHDGELWYSDFYDRAVHRIRADGGDERVLEVEGQPSGLGWMPDGGMLVVSMLDRRVLRMDLDGTVSEHADLSDLAPFHANDMVVDHLGRAYVGNFGFDIDAFISGRSPAHPATVLIRVDPDGTKTVVAGGLEFPNGSVITPDGETLIVAETLAGRLTAFTIGPDGSLAGRRVWAELGAGVFPDGICLDASGAVWLANATAPAALRVAEGGEVLDTVTLSQTCFAVMLGGRGGDELFVMTAPTSDHTEASAARNGRIESALVAVGHAGRP